MTRRCQVLQLTADGHRRHEVAALMCVSVETVKSHLKEARWELRARTTAEAVANALRQGMIR